MQLSNRHENLIPLFPLGVVLLPHMHLPLHIFEERYKLMIRQCWEQKAEFGIVFFSGDQLASIGCSAKIVKILKRYDDGRSDIITHGEKRFIIKQIFDQKPFLQANVVFFDDDDEENVKVCEQLAIEGLKLLNQFDRITGEQNEIDVPETLEIKSISFKIAGCEGFELAEKQKLLELTSTHERLRKGVDSLGMIIERIKISKRVSKIINGNGNLSRLEQNPLNDSD